MNRLLLKVDNRLFACALLLLMVKCCFVKALTETIKDVDGETRIDKGDFKELCLNYIRFLKEIIGSLDKDEKFAQLIKNMTLDDIKTGKIIEHMKFVHDDVRKKLSDLKYLEIWFGWFLANSLIERHLGSNKLIKNIQQLQAINNSIPQPAATAGEQEQQKEQHKKQEINVAGGMNEANKQKQTNSSSSNQLVPLKNNQSVQLSEQEPSGLVGQTLKSTTAADVASKSNASTTLVLAIPLADSTIENNKQQATLASVIVTSLWDKLSASVSSILPDEITFNYIIILFLILVSIVLFCFALRMFCCLKALRLSTNNKRAASQLNLQSQQNSPRASVISIVADNKLVDLNDEDDNNNKEHTTSDNNNSIWRNLSNTTTTIERRESQNSNFARLVGVAKQQPNPEARDKQPAAFNLVAFGDESIEDVEVRQSEQQRQSSSELQTHTTTTTSSQQSMNELKNLPDSGAERGEETGVLEPMWLLLEDRMRRKNVSTDKMTTSELVMVKEKLVPMVGGEKQQNEQQQQTTPDNRSAFGPPEQPDYVNASAARGRLSSGEANDHHATTNDHQYTLTTTRGRESWASKALIEQQQQLEFGGPLERQVGAIKAELARVEWRDNSLSAQNVVDDKKIQTDENLD